MAKKSRKPPNGNGGQSSGAGIPVDFAGGPTIDPTRNVLDLVEAAVQRVDDLREAETRRLDERMTAEKERTTELLALRAAHNAEVMRLRSEHSDQLRRAEAMRLDAIRAVDTAAVTVANERAIQQAAVLANQVSTSAETLRKLMEATAATSANQLDALTKQLTERIMQLERTQYEWAGKQAVVDPQTAQLLGEVKSMRETLATGAGRGAGLNAAWAILIGVVTLAATLVGLVVLIRPG
jgi:DNA anti-recombination protein RmuC